MMRQDLKHRKMLVTAADRPKNNVVGSVKQTFSAADGYKLQSN